MAAACVGKEKPAAAAGLEEEERSPCCCLRVKLSVEGSGKEAHGKREEEGEGGEGEDGLSSMFRVSWVFNRFFFFFFFFFFFISVHFVARSN